MQLFSVHTILHTIAKGQGSVEQRDWRSIEATDKPSLSIESGRERFIDNDVPSDFNLLHRGKDLR
ncbi:MAG: hypothetical protein MK212_09645 [Saprospiraceae bacterium]|nr:hypothetical protein [Saprospiraceae bacterium]